MLILLVLVSISLTTYGVNIGDECRSRLTTHPAKCVPYSLCELEEWTIENLKSEICDFQGKPVSISVCCPLRMLPSNFSTSVPAYFTTSKSINFTYLYKESYIFLKFQRRKLNYDTRIVGSLAKAKCAENAYDVEMIAMKNNTTQKKCPIEIRDTSVVSSPETYPHVATFGYDCGSYRSWNYVGNLISNDAILTAARWTTTSCGTAKWAAFGFKTSMRNFTPRQILDIKEIIIHPGYLSSYQEPDIAIVRLEGKVRYDEWARPACLSTNWYNLANNNNKAMLVGWGPNTFDLTTKYNAEIVDYENCKHIQYDRPPTSSDINEMICTELKYLYCQEPFSLIGFNKDYECMYDIMSISNQKPLCNNKPAYSHCLFTHINRYMNWIEKTAWPRYF